MRSSGAPTGRHETLFDNRIKAAFIRAGLCQSGCDDAAQRRESQDARRVSDDEFMSGPMCTNRAGRFEDGDFDSSALSRLVEPD